MARRYSDIKRAARLSAALTAYQAYLAKPPSTTLGSYTPRDKPVSLQILPFGMNLGTEKKALVSGQQKGFTQLGTPIAAHTEVAAAGENAVLFIGFSPARVITFENTTKTATSATSKITNLAYRKYAGDRYSCPFGRKAASDLEIDVGQAIRTTLKKRTTLEVNRISLTPERQRAR